MIDTIDKILEEIDSYYYAYCFESNSIMRIHGHDNSSCVRDLVNITNRLKELDIKFIVTENNHIQLLST